ncbi:MAG TPA: YihY/virulence factor BrkB family protein [Actinomycetota bacterium]|nr:YihY/virulence factor BrkB family protein [Actinomycetota bacterium]
MNKLKELLGQFDSFQRGRSWLAIPLSVNKKFGEDQAGYLAALVAYYGFFSLFPLLLVLVTVLGFVLRGNKKLQGDIVHSVLARIPIIGTQITSDIHTIHGSGLGLAVGIIFTLVAGLAVIQALQYGMDELWSVPRSKRPNFLISRVRALMALGVFGVAALGSTVLSGLTAGHGPQAALLSSVAVVASAALNFGILMLAFRVLTVANISWHDVVPGSIAAAILLGLLQKLGTYYVSHTLKSASQTYGVFALVIGLLTWMYLGAQITFYAAELNVVLATRLWPRGLQAPYTEADERAMRHLAAKEQEHPEEKVVTTFQETPEETPDLAPLSEHPPARPRARS